MTEIVLFHHAQGLTEGVHAFAEELRGAGHVVHLPDLYEGRTFGTLDEGMAYLRTLDFDAVVEKGVQAVQSLPGEVVYAGMSLGVMSAQKLAQTRAGAKGALLLHAAVLPGDLGGQWPHGVPLQVHTMVDDDWGDADVARELDAQLEEAEVFLYPGSTHLFTDRSLPDHDPEAAGLVLQRALEFLGRI
jgi:dienelactone hydrolase